MVVIHPHFRQGLGLFDRSVSQAFSGPVLPVVTGGQFIKIAIVGAVGVWLLKGLGEAMRGK